MNVAQPIFKSSVPWIILNLLIEANICDLAIDYMPLGRPFFFWMNLTDCVPVPIKNSRLPCVSPHLPHQSLHEPPRTGTGPCTWHLGRIVSVCVLYIYRSMFSPQPALPACVHKATHVCEGVDFKLRMVQWIHFSIGRDRPRSLYQVKLRRSPGGRWAIPYPLSPVSAFPEVRRLRENNSGSPA